MLQKCRREQHGHEPHEGNHDSRCEFDKLDRSPRAATEMSRTTKVLALAVACAALGCTAEDDTSYACVDTALSCGDEVRRSAIMRLGLDVGSEARGAVVVHTGSTLHGGAGTEVGCIRQRLRERLHFGFELRTRGLARGRRNRFVIRLVACASGCEYERDQGAQLRMRSAPVYFSSASCQPFCRNSGVKTESSSRGLTWTFSKVNVEV